jgi:hypothetical protein
MHFTFQKVIIFSYPIRPQRHVSDYRAIIYFLKQVKNQPLSFPTKINDDFGVEEIFNFAGSRVPVAQRKSDEKINGDQKISAVSKSNLQKYVFKFLGLVHCTIEI